MSNKFRLYSVLLILSMATLTLEVLQLRIFAYSLLRSLAHIVISIVLLGIGIGSISIALTSRFNEIKEEKLLSYLLFGFSLSIIVTYLSFSYFFDFMNQGYNSPRLWLFSLVFSIPYIFFGATLTTIFKNHVKDVPKLYSANLIGSGLGCVIPLLFLHPLGAEKMIVIVALMGALCALLYVPDISKKITITIVVYMIALLAGFQYSEDIFNFKSKTNGGLSKMMEATAAKREFTKWDPLGRIDVYSFSDEYSFMYMPEAVPIKAMFQDGDAGSMLVNINKDKYDYTHFFNGSIFSLVYQLREKPVTLAIGLGGGHDIMRAYHYNSKEITGIEINSTTVKMVKENFKDFLDDPYGKDNISIVNMDGRYFVRDNKKEFDIIQIAGADTDTSNLTTGALSVSENYLYTTQAFKDYFKSLKQDGVLSLIRFGQREPMLIIATAVTAMQEMGIKDIHEKFIVVKQAINFNVLMKKVPFTDNEIKAVKDFTEIINVSGNMLRLPANDVIGYEAINEPEIMYLPLADWNAENSFTEIINSTRSNTMAEYISGFPSNIAPLTDNLPFFFQYEKPENIFKHKNSIIYSLFISILQTLAFSILLIFLPVYFLNRKKTSITYNSSYVIYFLCIGLGFMLVELGLIQKSVLFLGHPTYSFIAVVFSILLFSGLGSLFSSYFKEGHFKLIAGSMAVIVIMTLFNQFFMEDILNILLPENTFLRMIIIGLFLSPIGFAMGIPFPKGLQMVSQRDGNFIPVAMGINSVASVFAASASVPFAMLLGFSKLFLAAIIAYLLGLLAILIKK